jgi:hypothetical protein
MQKSYLMSLLVASVVIPMRQAARKKVREGIRRTVIYMAVFVLVWGLGIFYIYWRLPP